MPDRPHYYAINVGADCPRCGRSSLKAMPTDASSQPAGPNTEFVMPDQLEPTEWKVLCGAPACDFTELYVGDMTLSELKKAIADQRPVQPPPTPIRCRKKPLSFPLPPYGQPPIK